MKLFVVLLVIAAATAAPQRKQRQVPDVQILRYDTENDGVGNFQYAFELSDGTKREEQGQLINPGTDNEAIAVRGQYSWVGPDGVTYLVSYVADENGFKPTLEQGPGSGGGVPRAVVEALLKG